MSEAKKSSDSGKDTPKPDLNNLNKIVNIIEKDQNIAKTMLAKLSGTPTTEPIDHSADFDFLDSITKPSWIDNVKKVQKSIITPNVKKKTAPEILKITKAPSSNETQNDREKEEFKDYPFFGVVKKIMYANGDKRPVKNESVVIMHNFVSKVINVVFDKQLLNKYFESEKKHGHPGDKMHRQKTLKLKKLLSKLYPQEYFKFFQFNKIAKSVERLDYDLEKTSEVVVDESKLYNYESENDSDDVLSFQMLNCNIKDEEKATFNHKRMEVMNEEEYLDFITCRSTNFLSEGKDKLLLFIDLGSRDLEFLSKNKNMIEFIAYILCRVVGNTIDTIVRQTNHGELKALQNSIEPKQIETEVEKHINSLKFRVKKSIKDSLSIEEMAFRLFSKESKEKDNIPEMVDLKPVKQLKQEENKDSNIHEKFDGDIDQPEDHDQNQINGRSALKIQWKKLPISKRKQWMDRIMAEKQVKEMLSHSLDPNINWDEIDPINSYAEFLINNVKNIQDKSQLSEFFYQDLFHKFQNNEIPQHQPLAQEVMKSENDNNQLNNNAQINTGVKPKNNTSIQVGKKRRLESIFG